MPRHPWSRAFVAALILLIIAVPAVSAHGSSKFRLDAVLDNTPSDLATAAAHHCHDLTARVLTCFTDAAERDWAVSELAGFTGNSQFSMESALSSGYVIAWNDSGYSGASVVLSQDYSNLGSIGWNDRISSYKVYVSGSGAFYEHSQMHGATQTFCCFINVSYVGDAYNDIFSSFELP